MSKVKIKLDSHEAVTLCILIDSISRAVECKNDKSAEYPMIDLIKTVREQLPERIVDAARIFEEINKTVENRAREMADENNK